MVNLVYVLKYLFRKYRSQLIKEIVLNSLLLFKDKRGIFKFVVLNSKNNKITGVI